MFESYRLKNKAKLILVPLKDTKSVTVLVMYPVGSRYETEKLSGVSHYIEHLMFKGTKKRKNTFILTREIDRLGAHYNAFTGKEYTGYYIKTDARYLKKAADILSDMLFNSKFEAQEMEREKQVIVEEIRMYNDNPLMNIDNIFESVMYDGSALGRDIAGTEKHVLNYKRAEVLNYRNKYYQPENQVVVVAGGIDNNTKTVVEDFFGGHNNAKASSRTFSPFKLGPSAKDKRIVVQEKQTDQAQLMIGFPAFPRNHKSNPAVAAMNTILGGSMSSRLFIQIRERRGLAYMVRSGVDNFRDTGYFYVRAGLETKNINKALGVIDSELEKIVKKGVTKRELKDAKTHIRGSLTLSLEDSSTQANWYAGESIFKDKIKTPEEKMTEIDNVSNDDIKAVADKIFKLNRKRVAVIGNIKKEEIQF